MDDPTSGPLTQEEPLDTRLDRYRQERIADVLEGVSPSAAEGYRRRMDKRAALNEFHREMQGY